MAEPLHETFQSLERLSDLVLVSSDGVEFRVHKVFLARSSPFFRDIFSTAASSSGGGQIQVPDTTRLQLHELEAPQLEIFLNFIYSPSGASTISLENVKVLTEAGRKYEMPTLLAASDEFCNQKVDIDQGSVVEWLGFAYEYDLRSFSRKCEELVEKSNVRQLIGQYSEKEIDALHRKVATKLLMRVASCEKWTQEWTVRKFSTLPRTHYSDDYVLAGNLWRILMFPAGNNMDLLALYLDVADADELPEGWERQGSFSLTLVNQQNPSKSITKEASHIFSKDSSDWGFTNMISLSDLRDPTKGFLVNDTLKIKVLVHKEGV